MLYSAYFFHARACQVKCASFRFSRQTLVLKNKILARCFDGSKFQPNYTTNFIKNACLLSSNVSKDAQHVGVFHLYETPQIRKNLRFDSREIEKIIFFTSRFKLNHRSGCHSRDSTNMKKFKK